MVSLIIFASVILIVIIVGIIIVHLIKTKFSNFKIKSKASLFYINS